jgi:hypothetical protein
MEGTWVHLTDPRTRRSYYANMASGTSLWRLPSALGNTMGRATPNAAALQSSVVLPNGWLQYEDIGSGRFYYAHTQSGQTTWTMPAEAKPTPITQRDAFVFDEGMRLERGDGEIEEEESDDAAEDEEGGGEGAVPVRPSVAHVTAKRAARRLKILEEILISERSYVQQLQTLRKVYLTPLRTVADNPSGKGQIMTHAEIDAIFINIELIVHVNEGFLAELEGELDQRGGEWKSVQYGEIMQRHGKQLKGCYTSYVCN